MNFKQILGAVLIAVAIIASADADETFSAGAATADITPQTWPVPMVGSFSERLATHALGSFEGQGAGD